VRTARRLVEVGNMSAPARPRSSEYWANSPQSDLGGSLATIFVIGPYKCRRRMENDMIPLI